MQPFARRYAVAPQQRALVVALSLGAAFAVLTAAATTGLTVSLDTRVILALGAGQSVGLIRVMVAASWLAGSGAVPLALLLASVLYRLLFVDLTGKPHLAAWLKRCWDRPAAKKARALRES